jgi:hypothetical protein
MSDEKWKWLNRTASFIYLLEWFFRTAPKGLLVAAAFLEYVRSNKIMDTAKPLLGNLDALGIVIWLIIITYLIALLLHFVERRLRAFKVLKYKKEDLEGKTTDFPYRVVFTIKNISKRILLVQRGSVEESAVPLEGPRDLRFSLGNGSWTVSKKQEDYSICVGPGGIFKTWIALKNKDDLEKVERLHKRNQLGRLLWEACTDQRDIELKV